MNVQSYSRLITLKIPGIPGGNTGTKFSFGTINDLRYARVTGIEIFTATDLSHAQPEPVPLITDAMLPKITCTFMTNDPDDIKKKKENSPGRFNGTLETLRNIPAVSLHRVQNAATAPFIRELLALKDHYIQWDNSFINIAPGGLGNETDIAFCVLVYYTFISTTGAEIQRT